MTITGGGGLAGLCGIYSLHSPPGCWPVKVDKEVFPALRTINFRTAANQSAVSRVGLGPWTHPRLSAHHHANHAHSRHKKPTVAILALSVCAHTCGWTRGMGSIKRT